jgi:hypothetical protein
MAKRKKIFFSLIRIKSEGHLCEWSRNQIYTIKKRQITCNLRNGMTHQQNFFSSLLLHHFRFIFYIFFLTIDESENVQIISFRSRPLFFIIHLFFHSLIGWIFHASTKHRTQQYSNIDRFFMNTISRKLESILGRWMYFIGWKKKQWKVKTSILD